MGLIRHEILRPIIRGLIATAALLGVYFAVLTLISGSGFAADEFSRFWYYVFSLAFGFGIQVGLYTYLKQLIHRRDISGKMMAITGTTSTASMISCCAHYLVNILPVLGATGIATIAVQYQVQFFWLGLLFNLLGIGIMASRIIKIKFQ